MQQFWSVWNDCLSYVQVIGDTNTLDDIITHTTLSVKHQLDGDSIYRNVFLRTFILSITKQHKNWMKTWLMRRTPKQESFYRCRPLTFFSLLIFPDCFSLVLHLASVSVTSGSMRRYLDPAEVSQAIQLLQVGTSIHAITRRFAVSPSTDSRTWRRFQETGWSHSRRAGQGCRKSLTLQQDRCLLLCVQGGTGWALPEPYKMTSNRPLVWISLTKQSETDFMRVAWGLNVL